MLGPKQSRRQTFMLTSSSKSYISNGTIRIPMGQKFALAGWKILRYYNHLWLGINITYICGI